VLPVTAGRMAHSSGQAGRVGHSRVVDQVSVSARVATAGELTDPGAVEITG
jgi:hypothetical protein